MRELTPVWQGTLEIHGRDRQRKIEEIMQSKRTAVRKYLENLSEVRRLAKKLVP
jgi:hypothetical protein